MASDHRPQRAPCDNCAGRPSSKHSRVRRVSHRPLALASGLTLGDYLLWNWSLNSNHDALALLAGLTLPPLAIACLWLLALNVARLIARYPRRPAGPPRRASVGSARGAKPA